MAAGIRYNEETVTWIIEGDAGPDQLAFVHDRATLAKIAQDACAALKWECGPSMRFNPHNLPTRQQLEIAVSNSKTNHPHIQEPGFPAMLTSFTMLETYISWLPDSHARGARNALRHLEARIEEIVIYRKFFREMRHARSMSQTFFVSHAWAGIRAVIELVRESTGIDLWEER